MREGRKLKRVKVLLVPVAEETYKLTVINIREAKYVIETRSQRAGLITDFTSWTIYCSKIIKPIMSLFMTESFEMLKRSSLKISKRLV